MAGGPPSRVRRVHEEVIKVPEAGDSPARGVDRAMVVGKKVHRAAGQADSGAN